MKAMIDPALRHRIARRKLSTILLLRGEEESERFEQMVVRFAEASMPELVTK